MRKTLIEQWREGKLPEGFYYMQDYTGEYHYRYLTGVKPDPDFSKAYKKILGKASNWEYYKPFVSNSDESSKEKILNLKKMLEDECSRRCELETKCTQLEKRLEIATKALKKLKRPEKDYLDYIIDKDGNKIDLRSIKVATKALKEMKGVK